MCSKKAVEAVQKIVKRPQHASTDDWGDALLPEYDSNEQFLANPEPLTGSKYLQKKYIEGRDAVEDEILAGVKSGLSGVGEIGLETLKNNEDEEAPDYLGRLASAKRTKRGGRGIGANILTSGAGLTGKANVTRKSLLG